LALIWLAILASEPSFEWLVWVCGVALFVWQVVRGRTAWRWTWVLLGSLVAFWLGWFQPLGLVHFLALVLLTLAVVTEFWRALDRMPSPEPGT
jgi:hypothetical protein